MNAFDILKRKYDEYGIQYFEGEQDGRRFIKHTDIQEYMNKMEIVGCKSELFLFFDETKDSLSHTGALSAYGGENLNMEWRISEI